MTDRAGSRASVLDALERAQDSLARRFAYEDEKAHDLALNGMREPAERLFASSRQVEADATTLKELRELLTKPETLTLLSDPDLADLWTDKEAELANKLYQLLTQGN